MRQSKIINSFLVGMLVSATALAAVTLAAATAEAQTANGPKFNKGSLSGNAFIIVTPDGRRVNNVAPGQNNQYEKDFVRIGNGWKRDGNYPDGGNRLEACQDGQKITLWIYAHNTVNAKNNHTDKKTDGKLDFKGTAIAKKATVRVDIADLNDKTVLKNKHTVTGILSAKNAVAVQDVAEIYCNDHKISISQGTLTPRIETWAGEATYDNQAKKHAKAMQVFGSGYTLSDPDEVFGQGSEFGYDGNLPGCRYYAAYVQVELIVNVEPKEPDEPDLPRTGFSGESSLPKHLAIALAGTAVAVSGRVIICRKRQQ